ncbi:MAG: hypothetical protein R3Y10_00100 [Ferrimonas sp.]
MLFHAIALDLSVNQALFSSKNVALTSIKAQRITLIDAANKNKKHSTNIEGKAIVSFGGYPYTAPFIRTIVMFSQSLSAQLLRMAALLFIALVGLHHSPNLLAAFAEHAMEAGCHQRAPLGMTHTPAVPEQTQTVEAIQPPALPLKHIESEAALPHCHSASPQ